MANQRGQVVMSDAEVWEFLRQQRSSTFGTVGPQGQIHLVGMWYAVLDDAIWFETKTKAQKTLNVRRDPRCSFLVEAGHTYDQLRGVAIEGEAEVIDDADVVWDVCVAIFELGRAYQTQQILTNAAREGARPASWNSATASSCKPISR